ncbi:MAG TPA: HupE/UreJ family protein [Bryobacteraceae bacterium]|nr:HupE/UreJ family protein [Bryobacteraceae bacterium]
MIRGVWLAFAALPISAHVLSMSSGDLSVEGRRAHYELRMPQYEVAHIKDPNRSIFENIHFSSGGHEARLLSKGCVSDGTANGTYSCTAEYEFAAPPDSIDVQCAFHSITVPNHVHLLHAEMGGKQDQAIFDLSFSRATLRFRPPTPLETAVTQTGAGFVRAWGGLVQILFLAALVLAGRSRKELCALAGMFLVGQAGTALLLAKTFWQPAPRFVEAAAALTVAYLAVEILLLPQAGARWLIAGVLGAFHGLYFHLFLETTNYHAGSVLAGAALAEVVAIAVLAFAFSRISRLLQALRPVQVSACALLAFGMIWFVLRLRG